MAHPLPASCTQIQLLEDESDPSRSGCWIEGRLHGRASAVLIGGDRYEGAFKDCLLHGLGVFRWKDGQRYEGEFVAGHRSGVGAFWDKDGQLTLCGRWVESKFVESCAMPLRLIPAGSYLGAAGQSAAACTCLRLSVLISGC